MGTLNIIAVSFGLIGTAFGIYSTIKKQGNQDGAVMSDIGYIKSGVDDIKRKQEKQDEQNFLVIQRLSAVEESAKSAHKRIDQLMNLQE